MSIYHWLSKTIFWFLDSKEVRKSNIIAVNPPLEMPLKEQLVDRYFAYITVNAEAPPPDMRLEGKYKVLFNLL